MDDAKFAALKARLIDGIDRSRNSQNTARFAREYREGRAESRGWEPPPVPIPATPHDDGMIFFSREQRRAENEAEHTARRRRADAEVAGRDRTYSRLRNNFGADYADGWME